MFPPKPFDCSGGLAAFIFFLNRNLSCFPRISHVMVCAISSLPGSRPALGYCATCCFSFNVCVFAYGQTGSGKTWTMTGGKEEQRGLSPRVVEEIFANIKKSKSATEVKTTRSFACRFQ